MSSAPLALKIKHKSGQHILKEDALSLQSKLSELRAHLTKLTQIEEAHLQIRSGFPPTVIQSNGEEVLENLGIKNGDTLFVEEVREVNRVPSGMEVSSEPSGMEVSREPQHHVREETQEQRGGVLLRRVVPSDNSCLFTSIGFVLNGESFSCFFIFFLLNPL